VEHEEHLKATVPHSSPFTNSDSFLFGNDSHTTKTRRLKIDIPLTFLIGSLYIQGSLNQINRGKSSELPKTSAKPLYPG